MMIVNERISKGTILESKRLEWPFSATRGLVGIAQLSPMSSSNAVDVLPPSTPAPTPQPVEVYSGEGTGVDLKLLKAANALIAQLVVSSSSLL